MTDPEPSRLETAMAQMQAAPDDTALRLRFHSELLDTELFLLLADEAGGPTLRPKVFDLSDGQAVLVFESEAQLAGFAGRVVPYAALPGRVLVSVLEGAGQGLSLLVNPDSPHAELLPPEAIDWLAATLKASGPTEAEAVPERFGPVDLPAGVLALLLPALERRLHHLPGLSAAILASVVWRGGGRGYVLALGGVAPAMRTPLARAVAEALELSGLETGALDIVFPDARSMDAIAAVGLALAPEPHAPPPAEQVPGAAPGMDPSRPPRLR